MPKKTVPLSSAPLRIAIVGAGQIGSAYAFQLAGKGNHRVTVVARPGSPRLAQLQRDGAIVHVDGRRAGVQVLDALDEHTPYDLIIVTVLEHQVGPVLPALQRSRAQCVQFMFNSFNPERLQQVVGAERCSFGMQFLQATLNADGRLKTVISQGQKTIMGRKDWAEVFSAAGLPATAEPNMTLWLRCHAPLCVAFESVCAAGERHDGGATWKEAAVLADGLRACAALIKAMGFPLYPRSKTILYALPRPAVAAMLWGVSRISSFRKLLASGKNECFALAGTMADAAAKIGRSDLAAKIGAMKPA